MGIHWVGPFAALLMMGVLPATLHAEPDPSQELHDAQDLARNGRFEEALQKHLWYHENALRIDPAQYGVRLSFALVAWVELGEKYPKARQALIDVRDRTATQLKETGGPRARFHDVVAINGYLKESAGTATLFRAIQARHPESAAELYPLAEESLFKAGEYALCATFIPDPMVPFETSRDRRERLIEADREGPQPGGLKDFAEQMFRDDTTRLVTILAAAGRDEQARQVHDAARKVQDDAALRTALEKALQTPPSTTPATKPAAP